MVYELNIDMRETALIAKIQSLMEKHSSFRNIALVIKNLPLGDAIITSKKETPTKKEKKTVSKKVEKEEEEKMDKEKETFEEKEKEEEEKEEIIFERKSVNDLMASIKDGRYEEQSYRLSGYTNIANHNIVYLIEGQLRPQNEVVYSSMFSIQFYKGFSVIRTISIDETAFYLCNSMLKMTKELEGKKRSFYYANANVNINAMTTDETSGTSDPEMVGTKNNSYLHAVKKVKKDNITTENIHGLMLCAIPGISSNIAEALIQKYKTIQQLLSALQENKNCLLDVTYGGGTGTKPRKIPKTIGEKLYRLLLEVSNKDEPNEEKIIEEKENETKKEKLIEEKEK
jgi:ERCC4-type nuclease